MLKAHVHINEIGAMRAAVVRRSHFLMITEFELINLFLNLMVICILLDDSVKLLAMITVIINRACTRVVLHFFICLTFIRVEIQASGPHEFKIGTLDILDEIILKFNLSQLVQIIFIGLRVSREIFIFFFKMNLVFHNQFLKLLVFIRQTFELLQAFVMLDTVT